MDAIDLEEFVEKQKEFNLKKIIKKLKHHIELLDLIIPDFPIPKMNKQLQLLIMWIEPTGYPPFIELITEYRRKRGILIKEYNRLNSLSLLKRIQNNSAIWKEEYNRGMNNQ